MARFLHTHNLRLAKQPGFQPNLAKALTATAAMAAFLLMGGNAWADYAAGDGASATSGYSTAVGDNAQATSTYATAIGSYSQASNFSSLAIGAGPSDTKSTQASGTYSTAVGAVAHASGNSSVALGISAHANAPGSVALGASSIADEADTVSVGGADGSREGRPAHRRIVNVANGTGNQDAATIAQLNSIVTIDKDPTTQAATGTVALKDATGTAKATVYTKTQIDKTIHNDTVHVALARSDGVEGLNLANTAGKETTLRGGTGTTIQTLRDQDKGVAAGTGQSGVNYQTTMYGADGDNNAEYTATAEQYTAFTSNGTLPTDAPEGATGIINEGGVYKYVTNVRLGGVAAGKNANDAVNVKQLTDALNNVSGSSSAATKANTRAIEGDKRAIDGNTQGIANTAANVGMAPLPAGAASGFTAGISRYNGKQGLAAGFQHRLNANTVLKAAVGTGTSGQPVTTVGLSYTWGGGMPSSTTTTATTATVHVDMVAVQDRLRSTETDLAQANTKANAAEAKANAAEAKAEHLQAELADVLHRLAALEGRQVAAK